MTVRASSAHIGRSGVSDRWSSMWEVIEVKSKTSRWLGAIGAFFVGLQRSFYRRSPQQPIELMRDAVGYGIILLMTECGSSKPTEADMAGGPVRSAVRQSQWRGCRPRCRPGRDRWGGDTKSPQKLEISFPLQWANSALERAKITVPGNSMQVEESCSHEKPAKCGGLGRVMRLDGTRPRDVRVG